MSESGWGEEERGRGLRAMGVYIFRRGGALAVSFCRLRAMLRFLFLFGGGCAYGRLNERPSGNYIQFFFSGSGHCGMVVSMIIQWF